MTTGGKKHKRAGKKFVKTTKSTPLADKTQQYAFILKTLGSCRFLGKLMDGSESTLSLRGALRKRKVWINKSDTVLVDGYNTFSDNKILHICYKYNDEQVNFLKKNEHINDSLFERQEEVQEDIFEFTNNTENQEEDFYKYIQDTKNMKNTNNNGLDLFDVDEKDLEFDEDGNLVIDGI